MLGVGFWAQGEILGTGYGILSSWYGILGSGCWQPPRRHPEQVLPHFCTGCRESVGRAEPGFGSRSQPHSHPTASHSSFRSQRSQGETEAGSTGQLIGWTPWGPPGRAGGAWKETEALKVAAEDGHAGTEPCTPRWGISVRF